MPDTNDFAATAAILVARRRSGQQGPRLPESCRPADPDAALAIQAAVTAQLGDRIAAWKCGMPAHERVVLALIKTDLRGIPMGRLLRWRGVRLT